MLSSVVFASIIVSGHKFVLVIKYNFLAYTIQYTVYSSEQTCIIVNVNKLNFKWNIPIYLEYIITSQQCGTVQLHCVVKIGALTIIFRYIFIINIFDITIISGF